MGGAIVTKPGRFALSDPNPYVTHAPKLGRGKTAEPVCNWRIAPP